MEILNVSELESHAVLNCSHYERISSSISLFLFILQGLMVEFP